MTRIFVLGSAGVTGREAASGVRHLRVNVSRPARFWAREFAGSMSANPKIRPKILSFQGALRIAIAIAGTLPVALLLSGALALVVPSPSTSGLRFGSYALLPIWGSAAGFTFLRDRAREVWVSLFFLATLAALLGASVLMLDQALTHGAAYSFRD
ncbi:MAG TPA: hypothetical protein VER96_09860 [Polyangiaceae bacterium]|nr:hypothetical protein [Polyangiaceae bacterium]